MSAPLSYRARAQAVIDALLNDDPIVDGAFEDEVWLSQEAWHARLTYCEGDFSVIIEATGPTREASIRALDAIFSDAAP